jgi:hypothetical protein
VNEHLWNIVRANIHLCEDNGHLVGMYYVRDSARNVIAGPIVQVDALTIASAHNDAVMAMMELVNEAKAPRVKYDGMGA